MLLNARAISHFYGSRLIFKDISMTIGRGSITLLAGANGAGKSTLLKILAGLIEPASGEIDFAEDSSGNPPTIGYIGHQTFLYPELTAMENLQFWADLYGLGKSSDTSAAKSPHGLLSILKRVELAPFADEKAKNFSRGMAQRLNLARVFMIRHSLLLLDEPGTGLDVRSSAILLDEVLAAKKAGAGIVWITHSLEQDIRHADTVAFIENRSFAYYGPAKDFSGHSAEKESDGTRIPKADNPEIRTAQGGEVC